MGGERRVITIGELGRIITGKTPSTRVADYFGGTTPFITPRDMDGRKVIDTTERYLTEKGVKAVANAVIPAGSIMVSCIGSDMGKVAISGQESVTNQQINTIIVDSGYDAEYIYYDLSRRKKEFKTMAAGSAQPILNKSDFSQVCIEIPPLPEQRAIAHILGTLDNKIELNRKMNRTLEAMAQAIFKSWFVDFDPVIDNALKAGKPIPDSLTKKAAKRKQVLEKVRQNHYPSLPKKIAELFPDEFEDAEIGPVPRGWRLVPLSEAIEVNPSRNLKRGSVATYVEMKHMPTTLSRPTRWRRRKFTSGSKFINGDVLLARITPCLENGKTAFVDFLKDGEVGWGSTEYIVLRTKPPLPLEFTYLLARSDKFREHAIANMTGTSGRQRVPASCFDRFLVCIPTEDVARAFESLVHPIFHKTKSNDFQSRILRKLHNTLLPRLINGEIEVDTAERIAQEIAG